MRRVVPYSLLPLSLIACAVASAPWLRAFPSAVIDVPLFGAAVLSVLAPMIVIGIGVRRLWFSAFIDLLLFVFFELFVTLREPSGFDSLYTGLVHGPSQILTFALPLVSPRTLLVAPVALCWVSGAIIGECVARGWHSVLPYVTLLVTFGLAYAGTARAIASSADGRRYDTLLAAALLLALLLLRAAQAWVVQDEGAEMTQPDGILPMRGLAVGALLSVVVALAAAGVVQSSAFSGRPVTPARVPPLNQSRPLTPVSFVADLRPANPKNKGDVLFKVSTDRTSSNYISLASVDFYDGDGWSFSRTFRPSGGVIPADADPSMRAQGKPVTQEYPIGKGAMTTVPWMPYLDRAQRVTGTVVNTDSASGMVVPSHTLRAGADYTVSSVVSSKYFSDLGKSALLGTSATQTDTTLANGLAGPLSTLVTSLSQETGTPSSPAIPFLQAVAKDFRTKSALAGAPATSGAAPSPPAASAKPGGRFVAPPARPSSRKTTAERSAARPTAHPTAPSSPTPTETLPTGTTTHTGGTTFADVLASIRGSHSATPEQYSTLTALVARQLNVPARVVSGFRIPSPKGSSRLPAGTYDVTTAEAWTWVEIPVRGLGWVVLDPSPGTYAGQIPQQSAGSTPSQSPSPSPSQNALLTHSNNGGHAVAPKSKTPQAVNVTGLAVVVIVLIVVALVAALSVAFLLARKRVRARRRRRAGDPRRRRLGAWQESLDVLVESGLPDLTNLTSAEVARTAGERFGGEPAAQARYIGDAANLAIFSPTSWVGPAEADAAWRAQVVLSKAVRRRLGWRDRIGARLRYNHAKKRRAPVGPASWAAAAKERATVNNRGRHARPGRRARRESTRGTA
jgi:hypothetical protein